jgi:hypothetical protein
MPQIRCPNCGLTINLENRKDTDMQLITTAVQHNVSSFTELLHTTRLPRKTLSIRLKEMCQDGLLAKAEGVYRLAGTPLPDKRTGNPFSRFSSVVTDKRVKGLIVLGLVLVAFPAASYALAALFAPISQPDVIKEPTLLGTFSVAVEAHDVNDLYDWQVVIAFNASELKVVETKPGNDFGAEFPFFPEPSDLGEGNWLFAATLYEVRPGVNIQGKGTLAIIVFGYYVESYELPQIVMHYHNFNTLMEDSNGTPLPISDSTLGLTVLP